MFRDKGKLFVLSGPSGCGKGTLVDEIVKLRDDTYLSVSATSRKPRKGEVEGKSYYFLSEEKFVEKIENNEFLEWAKVYDNYYGTPGHYVFDKLKNGENVILEIDIQGAVQIKAKYPQVILIFVLPPSYEELEKRIINRKSESPLSLKKRLASCAKEVEQISLYDFYLVNDNLEEAIEKLDRLIDSSKLIVDKDIISYVKRVKGDFQF